MSAEEERNLRHRASAASPVLHCDSISSSSSSGGSSRDPRSVDEAKPAALSSQATASNSNLQESDMRKSKSKPAPNHKSPSTKPSSPSPSPSSPSTAPPPTHRYVQRLVTGGATTWFPRTSQKPPVTYTAEVNVLWWVVFLLAFVTRFWRLDFPRFVVFDEVHFGKFSSYYLTGSFFFDVHPPLGKLAFAAVGYLSGFDGSFLFPSIGVDYPHSVPYVTMRALSALCGTLLVPCVYQIMLELGYSHRAALLAAFFTVFDNSLVVQSRVIMLDSMLILFSYLSILCYLHFYHKRHEPFSPSWHGWLAYSGVSLGCLLSVKYTGLLGLACVGLLVVADLWQLVADQAIDVLDLLLHTLLRACYLLGIPVLLNLLLFYIHFAVLTQSGPGNSFVSLAFRNALEGYVESPVQQLSPNATLLRYGSSITLRSVDISCWLHSHNHTYPLKYPDSRGSSYQQQVTCYDFADSNNFWSLRRPGDPNDVAIGNDSSPVRNKDEVELVHVVTDKLLNSHDVAAPLSPTLQEVAGYVNYSAQFVPHLQWQIDVVGLQSEEPVYWEPGRLKLRLLHKHSQQAMACTGKRLPEWAFQQFEVVTDRTIEGNHALWLVDDLVVPVPGQQNGNETWKDEDAHLREALKVSLPSHERVTHSLGFIEKFLEIQQHMATAHGNLGDHQFQATPQFWPLMGRTLPYWLDETSNAQVTLMGNPLLWWLATGSLLAFASITCFYMARRQRKVCDVEPEVFVNWCSSGAVLLVGWLLHYLPYFLLSRVLFLHHYLPALPFAFMMLAALCDHGHYWAARSPRLFIPLFYAAISLLCLLVVASFMTFAPFTYGYPALSEEQLSWRRWSEDWDLLSR